jgi:hypothetical protein
MRAQVARDGARPREVVSARKVLVPKEGDAKLSRADSSYHRLVIRQGTPSGAARPYL